MNDNQKHIDLIMSMKESGESKDDISRKLFESGVKFSDLNKIFKESGVKFRRNSGNTWKDVMADALINDSEIEYDDMIGKLKGSVKDPEYYVKAYLDIFRKMVKS